MLAVATIYLVSPDSHAHQWELQHFILESIIFFSHLHVAKLQINISLLATSLFLFSQFLRDVDLISIHFRKCC